MTAPEVADEFPTFTLYRDAEVWIDAHNPFSATSPDEWERVLALQQEIAFWDYQEAQLDARAAAMRRHPSTRGHDVLAGMTPSERAALTTPTPVPARSDMGVALGTCLGMGLVFVGVAVGIQPPHLSGHTILGGLLVLAGGWVLYRIERVTKGN